jgi:hypothetical protein
MRPWSELIDPEDRDAQGPMRYRAMVLTCRLDNPETVTPAHSVTSLSSHSARMKKLSLLPGILCLTCAITMAQSQTPKEDEFSSSDGKPMTIVFRERRTTPSEDPVQSLKSARSIFVMSTSLLVGSEVVETKLQKRPEFKQLGLVITRDVDDADLILEVRHDVFTKYVYTAVDSRTRIVVASGKLSSLGGTVGGKVAKRFLKQIVKARQS